jgi:imidazolonepropionase-like amidohydrolase
VNRLADLKVDVIKLRLNGNANDMSAETVGALIDQAHKRGLRTAIHIFNLRDAKTAVDRGVDLVGHSVRDQDVDKALIDAMTQRSTAYVPTLTRDLSVFVYETVPDFFKDPFFLRGIALYREQVDPLSTPASQQEFRTNKQAQAIKKALEQANRNLKILSDAGVAIAMGTDSGADMGRWQGYFEHVEMEMMVKAGMTPMQTLVASTSQAARAWRLDQQGSIEAGKHADLVLLDANPLQDIRNTRRINTVWIGGRRADMPRAATSSD